MADKMDEGLCKVQEELELWSLEEVVEATFRQ